MILEFQNSLTVNARQFEVFGQAVLCETLLQIKKKWSHVPVKFRFNNAFLYTMRENIVPISKLGADHQDQALPVPR